MLRPPNEIYIPLANSSMLNAHFMLPVATRKPHLKTDTGKKHERADKTERPHPKKREIRDKVERRLRETENQQKNMNKI